MKIRIGISIGTVWLLLLTAFLTPQLVGINTATALESSVMWGSRYNQPDEEKTAAADVCNYIKNRFNWYTNYDLKYDGYGMYTTKSNVEYLTTSCNNNYDYSVVFYTGHGWPEHPIDGVKHYHVYSDGSYLWANGIQDVSIQQKTTGETHYFVFLWACFQGNEVGYLDETGAVGMPFAWTQQDDLNLNGYDNHDGSPYCFLGFYNTSIPLHHDVGPYNYEYSNFVKYFYYFLTYHHETIEEALDDASDWVFNNATFSESPLWDGFEWYDPTHNKTVNGWMKVYGDSDNTLW